MQSCELHLHTYYSMLDGLNSPAEYMKRANEIGMTHMAITDHGVLSGHRDFQRSAKEAGVTPILGCEMYISATDRFDRRAKAKREDGTNVYNHLIVLAQDETGLKNLNRLSEIGWTEGFYSKPRIDMEVLEEHSDGLVVLSGCLSGLIAKAVEAGNKELALQYADEFKRIFGERFFIEVQGHNPANINKGLMAVARIKDIKPVVTSDCHYAREEDLWLEEAMLILATNPKSAKNLDFSKSQKMDMIERFNYLYPVFEQDENGKPVLDEETGEPIRTKRMSFQDYEIFLKSAAQQRAALEKHGIGNDAITNTMVVANMIGDYPYHKGLDLLPKPKNGDPDDILEAKAWAGLQKRGHKDDQVYEARLREELDIIKNKGFSTYFLVEADTVKYAKAKGIEVGPGRGSGVGSLVNYCLGITQPDPIEHNLLFFRFVNPERNDFPDIDTDIQDDRRKEVKDYLKRKFKHVASIATFGTFQGKNSVRDAARVFMVPLGDVNKALKGADWPSSMDFFEQWDGTEKGREFAKKYPEVIKLAKFMYGRIRSQGMHAGGIVVSSEPISKYAPMQSAKDNSDEAGERIPLVAVDMGEAENIGFIKYDFLGLKALSIIAETKKSIKSRHGVDIDLMKIPLDDAKVYKTLSEGYTKGVFQCEAVPYTNLLIAMGGVSNFDELVASNALVRPGAMKSTAGASFIARKKGQEMVEYPHPSMQEFTKDTYGVVIYQEQVMLTMTKLAGMPMATADKVRKIIGKKRDVAEFEQYKDEFIRGASENISLKEAERLWHDFEAHAGYSFNKSHAVAYSLISYWTAWLKEYYPLEFMCAVLKKEQDKDSRLDYLIETKRMGIRVMLPHVNVSGQDFEIQSVEGQDVIRFGLNDIKFISGKISTRLIDARPFGNYAHLLEVSQAKGSGISTRVLDSMNKVGAAAFSDNPRTGNERENFFEYLAIPAFEQKNLPPRMTAQFRPLDEFSPDETFVSMAMVRGIKTGPGWARIEIVDESGGAGVFTSEHTTIETGQMYVFLIANNRVARYITVDELVNDEGGLFQEFLEATDFPDVPDGMAKVVSFNSRMTKAGKRMADITFSDEHKNLITALVWPSNFPAAHTKCREGAVVDVRFQELDGGGYAVQSIY